MIDFKVSKILDLENVITGKYDFSLIGEKIRYYEKVILFDSKEYEIEKVKIELWSEDDLYNETRGTGSRGLTFEDFFAEENDYIKVISIDVAGNYNLFGTYLFVVNENTIITEYSGVYYLLEPVCSQEELIKINPKDFSDYNLEQPGSEVQKNGNEEIFAYDTFITGENTIYPPRITQESLKEYTEKLCVQENLIKINPTYFSKNDCIEYIGFIKIDNTLYKFYQNKHLFNDYRMTWRLIVIRDENIIGWYNQIQSTPKVEKSYLIFDFQEEYGNKIDFSKGIPSEVYLDGEIINFEKIKSF